MIKALIDTNIILDLALERIPFYKEASIIFQKMDENVLLGFISASTVTDIFYLIQKKNGATNAVDYLIKLLKIIDILGVDKNTIIKALSSGWTDFEDAVQAQVAIENEMDIIVKDFQETKTIKVLTPHEFISTMN